MGALWHQASVLLYQLIEFLYGITHSYGLSIVAITVAIRVILYPLNQKQMASMEQMQKIQPRLKMLQQKYGNDKQKLNEAMMQLYKEYKVNPAAGCLPLLIQLPILILLFQVLRTYNFAGTTFFGIALNESTMSGLALAVGAPANVGVMALFTAIMKNPAGLVNGSFYLGNLFLLVSIAILTWLQQKLTAGDNPQMAMMNTVMPFFMAFICLSMPGGVMLYWALSSLMGVLQQVFVVKKTRKEMAVKPVLHKNKPAQADEEDDVDEDEEDDDEDEK